MTRICRWSIGVVIGATIAGGCSDRRTEDEPDREGLCADWCEQLFGSCNPDPPANYEGPSTEAVCHSNCVDDVIWDGHCKWENAKMYECTTSLSCEEFTAYQLDQVNSRCFATDSALSSCLP